MLRCLVQDNRHGRALFQWTDLNTVYGYMKRAGRAGLNPSNSVIEIIRCFGLGDPGGKMIFSNQEKLPTPYRSVE